MHRFRFRTDAPRRAVLLALAATLGVAACSSSSNEESIEELIESQSGEDVELDLDPDGGISIESEDGSFSVDEEGNFVIEDESGEVITGQANDDGFVVETEDGETVTGQIDDDGFEIQTEDGETITAEQDGNDIVVESDDGTVEFREGAELPDEWPSEIPTPDGLMIDSSTFIGSASAGQSTVTGLVDGSAADFVTAYGETLEDAGLLSQGLFPNDDGVTATFISDVWTVALNGSESLGEQRVVITVFSSG